MTITADTMRDFSRDLGARLRAARNGLGLSLAEVEDKSGGQWKAVVLGSWERGDRQITVPKLVAIAAFYGVPVTDLLPYPPLVSETFTAITAAQEARFEAMAMRYEAELDRLRSLIPEGAAA